jgi:hypothetical protein
MRTADTGPGDDDPWGFAATKPSKTPASSGDVADALSSLDRAPERLAAPTGSRLAAETSDTSAGNLRTRARSLALALALVFAIGFITEVVAAARFVHLLGSRGLVIIYPLGGIGLAAVAFIQITWIDHIRRDLAFIRVALAYAAAFTVALILVAIPSTTVAGTGLLWLLADQLNFLLPLIVWAIIGDLFNAGEGRLIYPWITSWRYGGQLVGLAVPALAPLILVPLGVPLPTILIACPIGLVVLAIVLPRSLKGRAIGQGTTQVESHREAIASAWTFVNGVKAFKAMFITSLMAFIAGMSLEGSFLIAADKHQGSEARLQILYGLTLLTVFAICWLLQRFVVTTLMERLDIPGSLAILPIAVVAGGMILILGVSTSVLPMVIVGVVAWRVPWWSIDDVARRAALSLVPDERRARVSFIVDLIPFAAGLIIAGGVMALTSGLGVPVLAPILAVIFGIVAIPTSRLMMRTWQDALLNPQLRRRKRLSD